jgi:hypothetical protein
MTADQARPGVFQIGGIETFGEPAINGCQEIASSAPSTPFAPQPREARRGATRGLSRCFRAMRSDFPRAFRPLLEPVEPADRDASQQMKFYPLSSITRLLLARQPRFRCS